MELSIVVEYTNDDIEEIIKNNYGIPINFINGTI